MPILKESDGEYVYLDEFLIALAEPSRRPYPHTKQIKGSVIRNRCWEKYWLCNNKVFWVEGLHWLRWRNKK